MKKRNLLFRISIVIFSVFTTLYIIYSFSKNAKIGEKAPEFTTQAIKFAIPKLKVEIDSKRQGLHEQLLL